MTRTFNALIIGAGKIGAFYDSPGKDDKILTHAHAFTKHKGFNLVGFYDISWSKAEKAAKKWNTKNFKSISEAFRKNKIDVVSVAVPDKHHYSMLKAIIKYRPKLVFVEKPLTNSERYASKIVKLYNKYRIPLLVNYNRRFIPEFINEKRKIKKGDYGKFLGGVGYYGKGVLHNGSHMINTLRFLLGKVKLERILDTEPDYNGDPSVTAILNVDNKKFFMKHVNSKLYTIFEMDLLFEKARVRIVDSGFKIEKHKVRKSPIYKKYFDMVKDKEISTNLGLSCYRAVDNIHSFLKGKSNLLSDGDDALKDLRVCLSISKKAKINRKILLYSHDPGGANMIFPLVKPLKNRGYKVLLYGEKYSLKKYSEFGLKGINIARNTGVQSQESIRKLIKSISPNFVITGTSVGNMTERYIWQAAKDVGIPSFAILDSWVNYEIRFSSSEKGSYILPTKICIADNTAKEKVFIEGLTDEMLLVTGNPYFEFLTKKNAESIKQQESQHHKLKDISEISFLYISEPISKFYKDNYNKEDYLGYTEKTIFENIYSSIKKVFKKCDSRIKIFIKLHPQDSQSTYSSFLKKLKNDPQIKIETIQKTKLTNWELINSVDVVCGMGSTLLVEAFLLKKPVLSVYIGLKKDYPSLFDRRGMMKSIHSQSELDRRLANLIENGTLPKYNNRVIDKPIENIILEAEKIIWQS